MPRKYEFIFACVKEEVWYTLRIWKRDGCKPGLGSSRRTGAPLALQSSAEYHNSSCACNLKIKMHHTTIAQPVACQYLAPLACPSEYRRDGSADLFRHAIATPSLGTRADDHTWSTTMHMAPLADHATVAHLSLLERCYEVLAEPRRYVKHLEQRLNERIRPQDLRYLLSRYHHTIQRSTPASEEQRAESEGRGRHVVLPELLVQVLHSEILPPHVSATGSRGDIAAHILASLSETDCGHRSKLASHDAQFVRR